MVDDTENFWEHADAVRQLRIHYMLDEHFSLVRVNSRNFRSWIKVAGFLVAAAFIVVLVRIAKSPVPYLCVEPVETTTLSQEEIELCKARYASDQNFAHAVEPVVMKYEPGSVENPGAAIKVLEVSLEYPQGYHLHAGDRVWRQEIVLPSGKIRFAVGDGCVVTLLGPAKVCLPDETTVEIVSGNVLVDANRRTGVCVSGQRVFVAQASVGVVARQDGASADLLVTDGLVLLGMDTCLKPCDGFRILPDGSLRRYRSLSDGSAIRKSFLAGVSDIRIKERRSHAM